MKQSLSWDDQAALLAQRGLAVDDPASCSGFLSATNYYRFSGYARYFQQAPHLGDDTFLHGATFDSIRAIYEADDDLRATLAKPLATAEVLLRAHTAHAIAENYGPYRHYLDEAFYIDRPEGEPTVETCLRDIRRSKERHILRYKNQQSAPEDYRDLPIWSAVEAWSFGTLSKCIERGANGALADTIATSLGVAKSGLANRVRALVYLRNRCAHHSRLWHHSVIDSGPTPNNARVKAKKRIGQFEPRSVLDVIVSLDNILERSGLNTQVLPTLIRDCQPNTAFWEGLTHPKNPRDHSS